jgi:hypothetical protein
MVLTAKERDAVRLSPALSPPSQHGHSVQPPNVVMAIHPSFPLPVAVPGSITRFILNNHDPVLLVNAFPPREAGWPGVIAGRVHAQLLA